MVKIDLKLEWANFDELKCVVSRDEERILFKGITENGNKVSFWIPVIGFSMKRS